MTNIQLAGLALVALPVAWLYWLCCRETGWRYAAALFGSCILGLLCFVVGTSLIRHGGA